MRQELHSRIACGSRRQPPAVVMYSRMYCAHVWLKGAAKVWNSVGRAVNWCLAEGCRHEARNEVCKGGDLEHRVSKTTYPLVRYAMAVDHALHEDPEAREVVRSGQDAAERVQHDRDEHGERTGYLLTGCICYDEMG
jgi:hypothetical protein